MGTFERDRHHILPILPLCSTNRSSGRSISKVCDMCRRPLRKRKLLDRIIAHCRVLTCVRPHNAAIHMPRPTWCSKIGPASLRAEPCFPLDQCCKTASIHSPLRNDFSKLDHVSSQDIDRLRSLPDQQLAHPKHRSRALGFPFSSARQTASLDAALLHEWLPHPPCRSFGASPKASCKPADQSHLVIHPDKFPVPEVRA